MLLQEMVCHGAFPCGHMKNMNDTDLYLYFSIVGEITQHFGCLYYILNLGCHSYFRISIRNKNVNIWGYACFLGPKFFLPPDMQETFPSFE